MADLDEAMTAAREAVAVTSPDDPDRGRLLDILGGVLRVRFERTAALADLDEAVTVDRAAVAAASPEDNEARTARLNNLGLALRVRFEQVGNQADLDDAIEVGRGAVNAAPRDDPDRATSQTNLGLALRVRFEHTGNLVDLDEAVTIGRDAVAATPPGSPGRAAILNNAGISLRVRFERTGNPADLDEAVTFGREAVDATPPDDSARARRLSNLGLALALQAPHADARTDLDEAVTAARDAVAAAPPDAPGRNLYLSNLSAVLIERFERSGDLADLDEAIAACRDAVGATQPDHPNLALYLTNLTVALITQFEHTGGEGKLDEALRAGRAAAAATTAPARTRAIAARNWARAAASGGRWTDAVAGFAAATEQLGLVAPRSLVRSDQERLIAELDGLGSEAAACCVHAGLTARAVELFEHGRGVLLSQALDTRTDLTALSEHYPELASQFTAVQDQLADADESAQRTERLLAAADAYNSSKPEGAPPARVSQMVLPGPTPRLVAAGALDRVLAEIRSMPGFLGFLRGTPASELAESASDSPIVIVNASRYGSHALILKNGAPEEPIPLASLTPAAVRERVTGFLRALDAGSSPSAEQRLADTLGWLWDVAAAPVMDQLGIAGPPAEGAPWPRVWWCPSGLLSFLPFHAAGHHSTRFDSAPATVLDRVVSSYTPTIRALAHARRGGSARNGDLSGPPGAGNRVLAVTMPQTPGELDLPGAEAEVAGLKGRFPGHVTVLAGPDATHVSVLEALPVAQWAHFACHASSDMTSPSGGRLLLTDHETRPLTVMDVALLNMDKAGLAFLSACSTARSGDRLADEAIHLASAFQLAGYRQVIATLWPISDQDAVDITADIYTALPHPGDSAAPHNAAAAVHAASRRFRRRWPNRPSVWASHIHTGA
jgi:tetratricopeptide (TPR) repeat protein